MSKGLMIDQCPNCGKMYQQNMRNLCPDCIVEEDNQFRALERTMIRNRHFNNEEAAAAAGVPVEKIRAWIRSGKFRITEYPNLADECDLCKKPTRKGHLCAECTTRLRSDIADAMGKP